MHGPLNYVQSLYYTQKFSNCPSTFLKKTPFFAEFEIRVQLCKLTQFLTSSTDLYTYLFIILHCLDHSNLVVSFKLRKCVFPTLVFE